MLNQRHACQSQRTEFTRQFGDYSSIEVTLENALRYAHLFEWDWAGEFLLSPKGQEEFYRQSRELVNRSNSRSDWFENHLADRTEGTPSSRYWFDVDSLSWHLQMMEMAILFVKLAEEYGLVET